MSSTKVGTMQDVLLTTVVGSYPKPDWLVDRAMLGSRLPPRVRAREIWRVAPQHLEQAQDDATIVAIRDLERAGIDIIADGEIRRESYSNRFATALEGMDLDNPGTALDRTGHPNPVPRVVGPIRRTRPVEVRDVEFLRANTTRRIKATLPGPFTMSQQAQDDYYHDEEALALALADPRPRLWDEIPAAGKGVRQAVGAFPGGGEGSRRAVVLATHGAVGRLLAPARIGGFRWFWLATALSVGGDFFSFIAISWLTLQLTGSALTLGIVLTAHGIPRAALLLVGGALTDRLSARRLMIVSALARTVLMGAIALDVAAGHVQLGHS